MNAHTHTHDLSRARSLSRAFCIFSCFVYCKIQGAKAPARDSGAQLLTLLTQRTAKGRLLYLGSRLPSLGRPRNASRVIFHIEGQGDVMCFFISDCINSVEMYACGAQRVAYRLDGGMSRERGGGATPKDEFKFIYMLVFSHTRHDWYLSSTKEISVAAFIVSSLDNTVQLA